MFKNSAVASMIGLLELAAQGRQLVDYTSQPYEAFIAVTALYLALNLSALRVMRFVEAKHARARIRDGEIGHVPLRFLDPRRHHDSGAGRGHARDAAHHGHRARGRASRSGRCSP